MIGFSYTVVDHLTPRAKGLPARLQRVVDRAAFRVERDAKAFAPVDTGALRNSIYTVNARTSGAASAIANASSIAGNRAVAAFEMPSSDRGRIVAYVVAGVSYAVYVEYGHIAIRNTTRMSTRKSGNTAMRIADRRYGTFVQGAFFFRRAALKNETQFMSEVRRELKEALTR